MSQWELGGWGPVPQEILDKHPKINVSGLMALYESPAHYESRYLLKESEETKAMQLGTAIHMAVLEPERFIETYCEAPKELPDFVYETGDALKDACRAQGLPTSGTKKDLCLRLQEKGLRAMLYEEYLPAYSTGKTVLPVKEWQACVRICQRISNNDNLSYFVTEGEPEKLGWALHKRTQTIVTFKPDYFKALPKMVMECKCVAIDVKKVPNVKRRKFESLIWDRAMFLQAALYVDLIEALTKERTMFMWLAVESAPPYVVMGYPADFGLIEAGREAYEKVLSTFGECVAKKDWPVYSDQLHTVTLPAYGWQQLEYQDDEYEGAI